MWFVTITLALAGIAAAKPAAPATPANPAAGGHDLLRAQVLLDRAHFSSGEIDGNKGSNLRKAVIGFQKLHQLPLTGVLDLSLIHI